MARISGLLALSWLVATPLLAATNRVAALDAKNSTSPCLFKSENVRVSAGKSCEWEWLKNAVTQDGAKIGCNGNLEYNHTFCNRPWEVTGLEIKGINKFGTAEAEKLAELLRYMQIVSLDLSDNPEIGDEVAKILAPELQRMEELKSLNLSNTKIGDYGAKVLFRALGLWERELNTFRGGSEIIDRWGKFCLTDFTMKGNSQHHGWFGIFKGWKNASINDLCDKCKNLKLVLDSGDECKNLK